MNKIKLYLIMFACILFFVGCNMTAIPKTEDKETKKYALITKSQGNPYNDLAAKGFQEIIEKEGGTCIIASPKEATAEEQIFLVRSMIAQHVDSIAIAANDTDALQSILTEAIDKGIKVSTMDANTNAASRLTFVNQASTSRIGKVMMDAVYELTGGEGQWAILSATSQATNQNAWISEMQLIMEEEKYSKLSLVNIVYGQDDYDISVEKTKQLLKEYPNLKVICAPTTVGIEAVAEVLKDLGTKTSVKVTGLGLPSKMATYINGYNPVCPYMYLWNPLDMGRLSAYVSLALVEGRITGEIGESFQAGELGKYEISPCEDGGTEVIVAPPLKFDAYNIDDWKDLF